MGIAVIPIWYRRKNPALKSWVEFQTRLPLLSELLEWFKTTRNIAVITGWNDLTVIDFDNSSLFEFWQRVSGLKTYMVETARGMHVYFYINQVVEFKQLPGIDIKSSGGYVLAPPSVHPDGSIYRVFCDQPIRRVNSIRDVLPGTWLPAERQAPVVEQAVYDPWEAASNPAVGGNGSVDKIQEGMRIESMFPDKIQTGDNWYMTQCPFHDDTHPSFWIDTEHQICGCFAGCTPKPLDVINFYARLNGLDNTTAIFELAKQVG